MNRVVVDIETIGFEMETLDEISKQYLSKLAEREEGLLDGLGFSPLTGEIVAIGMLDVDRDRGAVYFQAPDVEPIKFEEKGIKFVSDTEAGILNRFWSAVKNFDQIITFNGRAFDAPFLIVRSAVHHIKPTTVIMPNRYHSTRHIDLYDLLNFYGAVRRRFNLHMWCRVFGIKSPKEDGITGYEVKELFTNKQYKDIARYCLGDLIATKELYMYWHNYIRYAVE
ncbi:MAG: 3'-5' exonuclease [Nitrospirae bacterium]|nr:MAG: 3'-5' exonuclease [Nitrospirota bacterium]